MRTRFRRHDDFIACYTGNGAGVFCQYADARVTGSLIFHARADERSLCTKQRYSLTLHVRTHQGTVGVIVFQERNHRSTDRNNFLRRYVHEVDAGCLEFTCVFAMTAGNTFIDEMAVFCQRFIRLRDDVLFFFISGNIMNIVCNDMRFFIDTAIRCFNEAEFIDLTVAGQRRNQADIRTFRCFYRAHTTIVRMVNVSNFKPCTFTGQAARS